ncbi:MAG: DUF3275 family protein [Hydrogenophilales bacterium]|nr:DUF3275 family protein [Hydrogenophilales bacterium]
MPDSSGWPIFSTCPVRECAHSPGRGAFWLDVYSQPGGITSAQLRSTFASDGIRRSGNFCVGELLTDIGSFKIKDAILDQIPTRRL